MYLLHTVVSSYEVLDIVELMKTVDSHIIVNVIKTENFFGGFIAHRLIKAIERLLFSFLKKSYNNRKS